MASAFRMSICEATIGPRLTIQGFVIGSNPIFSSPARLGSTSSKLFLLQNCILRQPISRHDCASSVCLVQTSLRMSYEMLALVSAGVAVLGRILYIANMSDEQTISKSTKSAVEKVLRDRLGQAGFSGADIRADRDSDGDPILLVDVNYAYSDKPISSKLTYGLSTEVRKALSALGETRFPHIRHHFDEQQKIAS